MGKSEEKYIYSLRIKQKIEKENRPNDRERTLKKGKHFSHFYNTPSHPLCFALVIMTVVSFTGKGHVHILDGFILPMDPRGLLGFFGIGKLKQEDIILLAQATVVAHLPSIEKLKAELGIGHRFEDMLAQIFRTVYELERRSFAPFQISVFHILFIIG
jgi:hypothetical protein